VTLPAPLRTPPRGLRAVAGGLVFLLLAAGALLAHPHPAPTLWLDIAISEDTVEVSLTGLCEIVYPWLGLDGTLTGELDEEQHKLGMAGARAWFATHDPVTIDGTRVTPTVASLGPTDGVTELERPLYMRLVLRYPCASPPRSVDFVWESFEGASFMGEPQVPTMITWAGEPEVRSFSEQEPEYTWHAPPAPPEKRAVGEVGAQGQAPLRLPVLSMALVLAGLASALVPLRRRWVLPAVLLGCALPALPVRYAISRGNTVEIPAEAEADRIMETLIDNVYRSFDAQGESRIYDVLSASVEGDLLEKMYGDVWESLILRDQGGAVCRVREVTHLGGKMEPRDADAPKDRFTMSWRWKVRSDITHWGHTHQRVTLSEAKFVVRFTGRAWKIHDYKILQQERTDDFSAESTQQALGRIR